VPEQDPALGGAAFLGHQVLDRRDRLLVGRGAGVEHVLRQLFAFVLHRVEQQPFSSSNTGSTDLRDTEVQQPKVTATLSWVSSWRAFSANSGQLEPGSTTTARASCRARRPWR
jgi:hypothetical protein